MFDKNKLSPAARARVLDYLIFKIKHGGNVVSALKSYMEGNSSKAAKPVQEMLDRIANNGESFVDMALEIGLIDKHGHLILSSSVEPAKALPVIRDRTINTNFGVSQIIILDVVKKFFSALLLGVFLVLDVTSQPIISIFKKMNEAAVAAGSKMDPLPAYLENQWLVFNCVLAIGVVLAAIFGTIWYFNRNQTTLVYRYLPFRFYEDWVSILDLYLAFKASGQSDYKAALSLASAYPEGSFISNLFNGMAESMKRKGVSFYQVLAEYEGAIPSDVLSFFLDASKTGQVDIYMEQARSYCADRLAAITAAAKVWTPAITGIFMLMTFGLMVADLFVSITMLSMKPITG